MGRPRQARRRGDRRAAVLATVLIALVALITVAAFAIDVTRLHVAAQRAQAVADAGAFAGGTLLPEAEVARSTALQTAGANGQEQPEWPTTVASEDVIYYPPGSTIYRPTGEVLTTLGANTSGLMVIAHVRVDYTLARIAGLSSSTATRYAVVVRGAASGMACVPMWISSGSPELASGDPINLLKVNKTDDGEVVPPGSFGFLDFSVPGEDWFNQGLSGYDISPAVAEASFVEENETLYAYTGERVGQWTKALDYPSDRTARMQRALSDSTWSTETAAAHSTDNPRVIQVPIVNYVTGAGGNAAFEVVGFAEMWLIEVSNSGKSIMVEFLEYNYFSGGGGDLDPRAGGSGGVYIVRPIA